jgi:acyl-CoA synthetase (AMP-forming)/AMP-acid ligase II
VGGSAGLSWKRWWRFRAVHRALGWKFWAVISGGATLPTELESFWNGLGFALIQGYGMTETAALVTLNHPFRIGKGTIGKPLPGREVKITRGGRDPGARRHAVGATWQGGSDARARGRVAGDGRPGGEDASGELRFVGRKGDVIVTGAGMNVHPADLEAAMTGSRACGDAWWCRASLPAARSRSRWCCSRGATSSYRRRCARQIGAGGVSADSAGAALAGDAVSVHVDGEVDSEAGGAVGLCDRLGDGWRVTVLGHPVAGCTARDDCEVTGEPANARVSGAAM